MNAAKLLSFLKLGYFIDYRNSLHTIDFSHINRDDYTDCTENELIEIGADFFRTSVEKDYKPNQINVIPLSGGLDSRALLAVLLEFTSGRNIFTYTFGSPGTYDYEIGNLLAQKFGTCHIGFDLTQTNFSLEELLDISRRSDHQTYLFHHPSIWKLDKHFKGACIWSGYIGDVVTGGYLTIKPSPDKTEAKKRYLKNFTFVKNYDLLNEKSHDFTEYIDDPPLHNHLMSYDEQVLYMERMIKLIAPHVLIKGYTYFTPFINNDFMNFMLSIPDVYRHNQTLYKKILIKMYPQLFSVKTKTNYGLSLFAPPAWILFNKVLLRSKQRFNRFLPFFRDKEINYIDFNSAIRKNEKLKQLFYINLMDLKNRKIVDWLPIDQLWYHHLNKHMQLADALITLVSLEIHLKSQSHSEF